MSHSQLILRLRDVKLILCILAAFLAFVIYLVCQEMVCNSSSPPSNQWQPRPGDVVAIGSGLRPFRAIPAAVTQQAFKQLRQAARVGDDYGLRELTAGGLATTLPAGTEVRILELGGWSGLVKVRVLDGRYQGQAFWLAREDLQPWTGPWPLAGQKASLVSLDESFSSIPAAVNPAAFSELRRAVSLDLCSLGPHRGLSAMVSAGRAVLLSSGTAVRIISINPSAGFVRIEILDGEHRGSKVLVPPKALKYSTSKGSDCEP